MSQRQRGTRVGIDERLFHRRFVRFVLFDHRAQAFEHIMQTRRELLRRGRFDHAMRDV
jgi:hypothetical protein